MRPLTRLVSRSYLESIAASTPPTPHIILRRIRFSRELSPTICVRCRLRGHSRPYSDDKKPRPHSAEFGYIPSDTPASKARDIAEGKNSFLFPSSNPPPVSNNGAPHTQRQELPSHEEQRRSHMAKRFSHVMDNMQSNIFIAGKRLNDLTGYSGIEAMKKDIEEQGTT